MRPESRPDSSSRPQRAKQGGEPVLWERKEILLLVPPPKAAPLDHEQLVFIVQRAAELWRDRDVNLAIRVEPSFQDLRSTKDGASTLQILSGRWCPEGKSGDSECYARGRSANTTLQSSPWQGREERKLSEADVVINGVERSWRLPEDQGELTAIVVHEIGHILGLEHPCSPTGADGRDCARFADDAMHPVPVRSTFVERPRPSDSELHLLRELYPSSTPLGLSNIGAVGGNLTLILLFAALVVWRKAHAAMNIK